MRSKRTFGFTIVELLVVITIIGLLMALLLPAVGRARNSARRIQCLNQIKQLGTASMNYASKREHFPGYINDLAVDMNGNGIREANEFVHVSWFTELLPFVDRNDLYDAIQLGVDSAVPGSFASQTYIDLPVCPTDTPDTKNYTHLSYAINSGVWDGSMREVRKAIRSPNSYRDDKANGIAHNLAGLTSGNAKIKQQASSLRVSPSYISTNDGSATTILLTENLDAFKWWLTGAPLQSDPLSQASEQVFTTVVWMNPPNSQAKINQADDTLAVYAETPQLARPSSNHTGGVVVTFADGHAEFMNEAIDQDVFARLMTPDGKNVTYPGVSDPAAIRQWQSIPVTEVDMSN